MADTHDVYVFCPNVKPRVASTRHVWRFPSVVYPFQREYRLVFPFDKRAKKIMALGLDIIHIHTPFTMGYIGLRVGKKLGIPIVHTYHTYFEKYVHYVPLLPNAWVTAYAKRQSERFCNQCDMIIVPSDDMNTQLSTYKIQTSIRVIPSGVSQIVPSTSDIEALKHQYCLDTYCIFIGRLGFEKNIAFLMAAFEHIRRHVPSLKLLIIGDGPERNFMKKDAQNRQIEDAVIFTGYQSKKIVFTALHGAKLMLFPSKTETQGLTVVESLMTGTPVIGLNQMGVRQVLEHNQGGIITDDDLDAYVDATVSLLNDDARYKTVCEAALTRSKDFTIERSGEQLLSQYCELVAQ